MKICSVCQRCAEDSAADCAENHGSLVPARSGSCQITADYRLDFLLERDAASETYQAARSGFDEPFTVEIISSNALSDAERREEIQTETAAAANLNHLNIARVYESGSLGDDEFYIVTEALSGQTLSECLRKVGVFPEAEAVMIARHAAEALEAAHKVGVIHRAVSPANIILARDGEKLAVKLRNFDFGGIGQQNVVAAFSSPKPPIDRLRYLSPEQCAGKSADARSDVYSLAVALYEMLCGRSPFGAPTAAAITNRRVDEEPLEKLGFDTRALLKHILRESLRERPEIRPQTAGNFARQLRHIEQLLTLPGANSQEAKSSTAKQSAPIVFDVAPPPESIDSSPEKSQPRETTTQKIADETLPPIPLAALPPVGQIEHIEQIEQIEQLEQIEQPEIAADSFSEPIRVEKREINGESFTAEPILIKKNESNIKNESNVVPFESAPIYVEQKFESAPISVQKRQADAPAPEPEPIFTELKEADTIVAAPFIVAAAAPEVIDLPDADIRETRKTPSNDAVFANSVSESRAGHSPSRRPLFVAAGLLALVVSVLLGALLYKRQHQPSAAQPTIAQTSASQPAETASDASGGATGTGAAEIEKTTAEAVEKSSAPPSKRENQTRRERPADDDAALQNESPKNRNARENPAAEAAENTRPRAASENGGAQTELNNSLAAWVTATNARNVDRQMNYYAPKMNTYYRTKNVSPDQVRAEKKRVLERADTVDIQTGKPEITVSPDGKTATMLFRKKYAIKQGRQNRSGEVLQELRWVKSGGGWRIVSERDVKVINR